MDACRPTVNGKTFTFKVGGFLSVIKPVGAKPLIKVGQDETIFKMIGALFAVFTINPELVCTLKIQYAMNKKGWNIDGKKRIQKKLMEKET